MIQSSPPPPSNKIIEVRLIFEVLYKMQYFYENQFWAVLIAVIYQCDYIISLSLSSFWRKVLPCVGFSV